MGKTSLGKKRKFLVLLQCSQGTEHVIYSNKSIYFNIGSGSVPAAVQPQDWAELGEKEIFGMHLPKLFTLGIAGTLHVLSGWKSGISGGAGTAGSSWFCSAGAGSSPKAALGKGPTRKNVLEQKLSLKRSFWGLFEIVPHQLKQKSHRKGTEEAQGTAILRCFIFSCFKMCPQCQRLGRKPR